MPYGPHRHISKSRRRGRCPRCLMEFRERGYCSQHRVSFKCCWNFLRDVEPMSHRLLSLPVRTGSLREVNPTGI